MSGLKPSILTPGKFLFYSVSEHGITFTPETPRDEWLDAIKRLLLMHDGAVFTRERTIMLLADALNFGEEHFSEEFAQAIDGTRAALGLSPKTISNAQWVYKQVPVSLRRDGIGLGHYSVIAALPEENQKDYIAEALKEKLTIKQLRDKVAESHPKTARAKARKTTATIADEKEALETAFNLNVYLMGRDINDLPQSWKPILEVPYKIYRRRWLSKRRKK